MLQQDLQEFQQLLQQWETQFNQLPNQQQNAFQQQSASIQTALNILTKNTNTLASGAPTAANDPLKPYLAQILKAFQSIVPVQLKHLTESNGATLLRWVQDHVTSAPTLQPRNVNAISTAVRAYQNKYQGLQRKLSSKQLAIHRRINANLTRALQIIQTAAARKMAVNSASDKPQQAIQELDDLIDNLIKLFRKELRIDASDIWLQGFPRLQNQLQPFVSNQSIFPQPVHHKIKIIAQHYNTILNKTEKTKQLSPKTKHYYEAMRPRLTRLLNLLNTIATNNNTVITPLKTYLRTNSAQIVQGDTQANIVDILENTEIGNIFNQQKNQVGNAPDVTYGFIKAAMNSKGNVPQLFEEYLKKYASSTTVQLSKKESFRQDILAAIRHLNTYVGLNNQGTSWYLITSNFIQANQAKLLPAYNAYFGPKNQKIVALRTHLTNLEKRVDAL